MGTPPGKRLGSVYEQRIEELELSVAHWRGQAESAWKREDAAGKEIETLKKRIRELEEKRAHSYQFLGCDLFDDDAFTEGMHEAGERFWNKEGK